MTAVQLPASVARRVRRAALLYGLPAAAGITVAYPGQVGALAAGSAAVVGWRYRRRIVYSRFDREYIAPTLAALTPALGMQTGVSLHVDRSLGNLKPRLAKPLSPAEQSVRAWYGQHMEPVVRWAPDRVQRALWAVQRWARPATRRLDLFRRPTTEHGPRIELTVSTPYLTREQRQLVSSIIGSKIPAGQLVETWEQVGPRVVARWTVRKRPPARVSHEQLVEHLPALAEWEFYIGQTTGDRPVTLSLRDDSPHIAVSAGTGAGKSVLAQLIAVQVLARGGRVIILDRKGSHRWAVGMTGVDYCTRPEQMHHGLIRTAGVADERNTLALHEPEDWDPGERTLVICEELNATIGMLANYWAENRDKSDPKKSPAISALADLLFMGRSAKVNVLAIAQMLTARSIGGPEARENFGIRALARYTANNWKMLVPEASMPRASRTLGRWQIVVGGQATETQVCYLTAKQARAVAMSMSTSTSQVSASSSPDADMMTLHDAIGAGILPWSLGAAQKRIQRRVGEVPAPQGKRGNADLYRVEDLRQWAESKA